MRTVTIRKINFRPYIQWAVIAYTIFGLFTGFFETVYVYLRTGTDLGRNLLWYAIGIPVMYFIVGMIAGSLFVFLYNSFSKSMSGYRFEIEIDDATDLGPPPPPSDLRPEGSR